MTIEQVRPVAAEVRFSRPPGRGGINVVRGQQVVTADGATIGTVAGVAPGHFRVDARAHDFWLATRDVLVAVGEVVHLAFEHVRLPAYRCDRPAPFAGHVVEALAVYTRRDGTNPFGDGE